MSLKEVAELVMLMLPKETEAGMGPGILGYGRGQEDVRKVGVRGEDIRGRKDDEERKKRTAS